MVRFKTDVCFPVIIVDFTLITGPYCLGFPFCEAILTGHIIVDMFALVNIVALLIDIMCCCCLCAVLYCFPLPNGGESVVVRWLAICPMLHYCQCYLFIQSFFDIVLLILDDFFVY